MMKYKLLQRHIRSETQIYFLKTMTFCVKPVILISVIIVFLLRAADTIASDLLFQLDHPRITHFLANRYDCSKQYN